MIFERQIASGPAGVRQTLEIMRELALAGGTNSYIRGAALSVHPEEYDATLRSLWVFQEEAYETLMGVGRQVQNLMTYSKMIGDCDDAAIIAGCVLHAAGAMGRFVAVRRPADTGFSHVFTEIVQSAGIIRVDPTAPINADYRFWERLEVWI